MNGFTVYPLSRFMLRHHVLPVFDPVPAHAPLDAFLKGNARVIHASFLAGVGMAETLTTPIRFVVGNSILRGDKPTDPPVQRGYVPHFGEKLTWMTSGLGALLGTGIGLLLCPFGAAAGIRVAASIGRSSSEGRFVGNKIGEMVWGGLEVASGGVALIAHAAAIVVGLMIVYPTILAGIFLGACCAIASTCGLGAQVHPSPISSGCNLLHNRLPDLHPFR